MAIVYRTTGAWGAGKGSPLTKAEGDSNLYQIVTRVAALESSLPAAAVGISSINVTGDQMSIILSDATTEGPFTLPTTTNTYKGAWTPSTTYAKYDRFTNNGNLYEVLFPHTSGLTFDPNANDGIGDNYYELLLTNPGATLPTGGNAGYLLSKNTSTDFDFTFIDPTSLALPFTSITGTATAAQIPLATNGARGGVFTKPASAGKFLTSIGSDGVPVLDNVDFSDLTGTLDPAQIPAPVSVVYFTLSTTSSLILAMANGYIPVSTFSNITLTIPPESSVAWADNTEMTFRFSGGGSVTLAAGGSVTLNVPVGFQAKSYGDGATMTIKKVGFNTWDLFGLLATV